MEHPKILHNGVLVHTTNSEGKPIHHTEEGIRNFHDWFGGSKVVDEHGRPQVVYHGTGKDFNKVDTKKGSQGVFWFGTNKSEIASGDSGAESAKVIKPLYMQLHNPAGWDDYEDKSITELVRNGHDGVILPDSDKHFNGFIFKPNQVKSTTNNGLFSMKSDKLNESVDARPHKLVDKHGYEYSFDHPMMWHNDTPVHTTNSEGKPIHHTEEGIRNFHDWFGKSKMVDKHGRPQVFYHGTSEDFSEFDPTRSNANTKTGVPDATHFFSNDPEAAQSYAKEKSDFLRNKIWGEGGNVKPVYIKADKILKIDAKKDAWNNIYYKERGERTGDDWNINDLSELAKGKKYHALVVTNVHDRQHGSGKPATSVAIFKHNDVKSVYNSGNFSSKTANISESLEHPKILHNGVMVHTTNSDGQPIHHTEQGVKNFHDWFGDSKIVDEHGRPQIVYHGTGKDFSEFTPNSALGGLIFVAKNPKQANSFATYGGSRIMPMYAKANKIYPKIVLATNEHKTGISAKKSGYDAIRVRDSIKDDINLGVFNPSQLKSVYNSGNFSPKTANISEAIKNKFKELSKIQLKESVEGKTVLYHVSPFAKFDGTRKTSLDAMNDHYNALQDELDDPDNEFSNSDYTDKKRALDKLDRGITRFSAGGRVHDDISHADKDSFYATSQPEYWQDTMQDEHGTDYSKGGIYKIELHKPQEEDHVSAGMGDMAPQAIVHKSNVKRVTGPFKTMKDIK